jgi:ferredoxin
MTIVARIDALACAAHGDCAVVAPDVFQVDGAVAVVVGAATVEVLFDAADACPSVAIALVDERTGESVYP